MEESDAESGESNANRRMLVIDVDAERYAFPVDEVLGISRISLGALSEPPVTISKAPTSVVEGIFSVDERKVGLLSEERLIESLKRSLKS